MLTEMFTWEIMSSLFNNPVVIMKEIMYWLFKNPINSDMAQFDHAQSNSKKMASRLKRSNCPKWIFFSKN